jgi:hypothetical protein
VYIKHQVRCCFSTGYTVGYFRARKPLGLILKTVLEIVQEGAENHGCFIKNTINQRFVWT